ncbi:glycosyltransferase, partial [Candidatus Bathyarchaeota archaeon]|nr:glycosyltransferase [Candidatus Bathyarchaeota archaeon]
MLLEFVALALALVHFGFPLAYYWYARARWLNRPWNVKVDDGFRPRVTVIVPTYNEAGLIVERLDNIYSQDYPKNLLEIIVVDSASTDKTAEFVEKWIAGHKDVNLRLLRERERQGKLSALLKSLNHISPS